ERLSVDEAGAGLERLDVALLGQRGEPAAERVDDLQPVAADAVDVDLRLAELNAEQGRIASVGDQLGGVQQGLGRNAADAEAGTAEAVGVVNKDDGHPLVGGEECGNISSRPAADDNQFVFGDLRHAVVLCPSCSSAAP